MKQPIGEFLATLRKANGYTQQEIADKLGLSNKTVSAWERGTVMPDVLLLPALAELYGVTTDEILAGERKSERGAVSARMSEKSETKLLKLKLGKFTTQAFIIAGVFLVGAILFYVGSYLNLVTIMWSGWRWWLLLLYLGLAAAIVSLATLLALFSAAINSADGDAEKFPAFAILLYRRLTAFGYFAAAVLFLFAVISIFLALILTPIYAAVALAVFLLCLFANDRAQRKWNGETNAGRRKRNLKLYLKVALLGLIPLAVAIAAVPPFFSFNVKTADRTVYSADLTSFTAHMESVETDGKKYEIPLSQLAKSSDEGVEYEYGDGVKYTFGSDACTVKIGLRTYSAPLLTAADGFSVYNLRYCTVPEYPTYNGGTAYQYVRYELRSDGNTASYCRITEVNFGMTAVACGTAIIAADVMACFVIAAVKREKTEISL